MGDILAIRKPSPFALDDVVRVIEAESGTKLKPNGDGSKWLGDACPQGHSTPKVGRFVVYAADRRWWCHGCQQGGDLYAYVMAVRGVHFAQARRILQADYGIHIESNKVGEVAVTGDLDRMVRETWRVISSMDAKPNIYRMGEATVRLVDVEEGRVIAQQISDGDTIIRELEPIIFYYKTKENDDGPPDKIPHTPPTRYGKMLLADRAAPWPFLGGIVDAPFVTRGGRIARHPGFYEDEGVYLQPYSWELPQVPDEPSGDELEEAKRLLLDELLGDFPFVDEASRTHAVALALTPIVRPLIDGPTPLFLATATKPGSGKGLLCSAALTPALGKSFDLTTVPTDEDEIRKTLTTFLLSGSRGVILDNVETLRGGNLASILTAETFKGRKLGRNELLVLPNRATWAATGNNVMMSEELARRAVPMMLHVKKEKPWERTGFRHPSLLRWAQQERGRLLWALLVLVRHWWAAGRPVPTAKPMGSFEAWHEIVGGICEAAGLQGFLANRDTFYEKADQEGEAWRQFFRLWWDEYVDESGKATEPVEAKELLPIVENVEGIYVKGADESAKARSLSRRLGKKEGAVYGDMMLVKRKTANAKGMLRPHWLLQWVGDDPTGSHHGDGSDPQTTHKPDSVCGSGNGAESLKVSESTHKLHKLNHYPEKESCQGSLECNIERDRRFVEFVGDSTKTEQNQQPTLPTNRNQFVGSLTVRYVDDPSGLPAVLRAVEQADVVAVDTETTGLHPIDDRIRLLQVAVDEQAWVLDLFHLDASDVAPLLQQAAVYVFFNGKFDLSFLKASGLPLPERVADVMLMDCVFRGLGRYRSLKDVAADYLDVELDKGEQRSDWSSDILSDRQIRYAAQDAAILLPLYWELRRFLEEDDLWGTAELEHEALPAVVEMVVDGTPLDAELWREQAEASLEALREAKAQLDKAALEAGYKPAQGELGGGSGVNWSSGDQVKAVFRAVGIDLADTRQPTLRALGHPLAEALLAYRAAAKRCSAYGLSWLEQVGPDGRIRGSWKQIGAATGRMSCPKPPLQTLPRDPAIRRCIRPEEGRVLIKADYSQIELRVAAVIAGERRMLEAYREGRDLHRLTASLVLGKPEEAISKSERQLAKAINFGLLFGMQAAKLRDYAKHSYGVDISLEDAERFRSAFFRAYPALRRWHYEAGNGGDECRSLGGRIRREVRSYTERLNTPVQSTAADGAKAALALFYRDERRPADAKIVLAVHDEIVVECRAEDAEHVKAVLVDCMKRGMERSVHGVPIEVEATVARDWAGTPVE